LLSDGSDDFVGNNLESIESDSLGDGSALSGNEDITFGDSEARRNVDSDVSVSLLVSVVLSDVVEIILSDDDGLVHLGGNNQSPERQQKELKRYDINTFYSEKVIPIPLFLFLSLQNPLLLISYLLFFAFLRFISSSIASSNLL